MKFDVQATIIMTVEVEAVSIAAARDVVARLVEASEPSEQFVIGFAEAYRGTSTKINPNVGFAIEGSIDVDQVA